MRRTLLVIEPHADDALLNTHEFVKNYERDESNPKKILVTVTDTGDRTSDAYAKHMGYDKIIKLGETDDGGKGGYHLENRKVKDYPVGKRFESYRRTVLEDTYLCTKVARIQVELAKLISKYNPDTVLCSAGIGHIDHFVTSYALQNLYAFEAMKIVYYFDNFYNGSKYAEALMEEMVSYEDFIHEKEEVKDKEDLYKCMKLFYPSEHFVARCISEDNFKFHFFAYHEGTRPIVNCALKAAEEIDKVFPHGYEEFKTCFEKYYDPWNCISNALNFQTNLELLQRFYDQYDSIHVMGGGRGYEALYYRYFIKEKPIFNVDYNFVKGFKTTEIDQSLLITDVFSLIDYLEALKFFSSNIKVFVFTDVLYYLENGKEVIDYIVKNFPGSLVISGDSWVRFQHRTRAVVYSHVDDLLGKAYLSSYPIRKDAGSGNNRFYKAVIGKINNV